MHLRLEFVGHELDEMKGIGGPRRRDLRGVALHDVGEPGFEGARGGEESLQGAAHETFSAAAAI
jgi:hypothetical protein